MINAESASHIDRSPLRVFPSEGCRTCELERARDSPVLYPGGNGVKARAFGFYQALICGIHPQFHAEVPSYTWRVTILYDSELTRDEHLQLTWRHARILLQWIIHVQPLWTLSDRSIETLGYIIDRWYGYLERRACALSYNSLIWALHAFFQSIRHVTRMERTITCISRFCTLSAV